MKILVVTGEIAQTISRIATFPWKIANRSTSAPKFSRKKMLAVRFKNPKDIAVIMK